MSSGVEYVVAAYGVIGFALVVYLVMAVMKRARLAREQELLDRLDRRGPDPAPAPEATDAVEATPGAGTAPEAETVDR